MASSPTPPSPPSSLTNNPRPDSTQLYYAIVAVAVIAVLLLIYNAIAVGWCSQNCPFWTRRWRLRRGSTAAAAAVAGRPSSQISQLIPIYKYRKEQGKEEDEDEEEQREKGGGGGGGGASGAESQCSVCLSAFADGEDVRRLPKCRHAFHAACIDMWLCSHVTCPLCRASVLPPPPTTTRPPPPISHAAAAAVQEQRRGFPTEPSVGGAAGIMVVLL